MQQRIFDSVLATSAAALACRLLATGGLLFVATVFLPADDMGRWGILLSIFNLLALLEYACGNSITRAAAYAWGGSGRLLARGIESPAAAGRGPNHSLLREIAGTAQQVGNRFGLVLATAGLFLGFLLVRWIPALATTDFQIAWLLLCLSALLGFRGTAARALLPGLGEIAASQRITAAGWLSNLALGGAGMLAGFRCSGLALGFLFMPLITRALATRALRPVLRDPLPPPANSAAVWAALWPNLWRMTATSLGTHLIVQFNIFAAANSLSLATAGSYSLSLQVVNLAAVFSGIFIQPLLPAIAVWRAQGDRARVAREFARGWRAFVLVFVLSSLAGWVLAPLALSLIGARTPLLPAGELLALYVIIFLESHHSQFAGLVISENDNPFVAPALLSGLAVAGLALVLAPTFGVAGLLAAQGGVQALWNNWWPVRRGIQGLGLTPGQFLRLCVGSGR